MPAFLAPLLIGATIGAITNPDDRLRGALLGGTLGALTGGLGGAAAGGAGTNALSGATAASGASNAGANAAARAAAEASAKKVASNAVVSTASGASNAGANAAARAAGKIAAKDAAAKAASQAAINSAKVGAPIDIAQIAAKTPALEVAVPRNLAQIAAETPALELTGANRNLAQIAAETPALEAGSSAKLSAFENAKAAVKDKPIQSSYFASSVLGGGEKQQAAPVQMAPLQQGSFGMPMTAEERLAMSGGDDPMFVQRGLFSEVKSDFQTEEEKELMMQQMRLAGLV